MKFMRIGIDAKWYYEGPPSGKLVVVNLIREFAVCNTNHEFIIFLDRRFKKTTFPHNGKNIRLVYVWAGNNLLSNLFILPIVASRHRLDALFYQNFTSPFGSYAKITCIYDVIFVTHPEYYTLLERIYFLPIKLLAKFATRLATISYSEKQRLIDNSYARSSDIDVVYLGVGSCFKPKSVQSIELLERVEIRYKLPQSFLLYVGRLNSRKNVPNLLRACALLKNKNIPLVLVGTYDWKTENLERILEQLRIKERVMFLGSVESEELGLIYSLSTIFCFPSFEEAFGLPPLEAMASGIPVVVSKSSSIPEVCGDAGNYVDANDPNDIAKMIDELLVNHVLYDQQKEKGLLQAKKFQWNNSLHSILNTIQQAVDRYTHD
jgi:glycosyltransferase involved in cell wall biosynthesis